MDDKEQCATITLLGTPAVVAWPVEADISNADALTGRLVVALQSAASVVVADLTSTEFCDSSAVRSILLARSYAIEHGRDLRVVVCSGTVRRVMNILGVDQVLHLYDSVGNALGDGPRQAADGAAG